MAVFVLRQTQTFATLAAALDALGFELHDVRACTFPSRPEPRSARWTHGPVPALSYHYEPDLEVRMLHRTAAVQELGLGEGFDVRRALTDALGEDPFEAWSALRDDLCHQGWPRARRAAASWRARAQLAGDELERELCAHTLAHALQSGPTLTRRAILEQLASWTHRSLRAPILAMREDPDLEVRIGAHRAHERLESLILR